MIAQYPISMIQHDWQADVSPGQLCKIYGIKKKYDLYLLIQVWRRAGWKFDKRKAGYRKRVTIHDTVLHNEIHVGKGLGKE